MFSDAIRAIYVAIELKDRGFYEKLTKINRATDEAVKNFKRMNQALESLGKYSFAAGAAMSASIGLAVREAANLERAILEMQARTGISNKELILMTETVKQLARVNSDSFKTIAEVITIIRGRYGDLGRDTQEVAQAVLDFAKVTGTDAVTAANSLAVAMKAFNIPATRMYEVTDTLIAAQQRFGVQSSRLIDILSSNAAPLKQLNLTFQESVGLLAALESNGVNVARALMGLRSAAAKGIDVKKALKELAEIRDSTERTRRATAIFGSYAGPGIARVLEGGIDALDKYMLKLEDVRGVTKKASAEIDESLSEQLGILKNNLKLVGTEIGSVFVPSVKVAVSAVRTVAEVFQALPKPIKTGISLTVGLATAVLLLGGGALLVRAGLLRLVGSILTFMGAEAEATLATIGLRGALTLLAKQSILAFVGMTRAFLGFSAALLTNPITWAVLGLVSVILLLQHCWVHNLFGLRDRSLAFFNAIRGGIDWLVSGFKLLADVVTSIPNRILEAWRVITENPIFKAIQAGFQFTPTSMAIRAGTTLLAEHRLPSASELLPSQLTSAPTTYHTTNQTTYNQPTTIIHKIEIKADRPEDITKELVRKLRLKHYANLG